MTSPDFLLSGYLLLLLLERLSSDLVLLPFLSQNLVVQGFSILFDGKFGVVIHRDLDDLPTLSLFGGVTKVFEVRMSKSLFDCHPSIRVHY